jgi:hypothetical protein
MCTPVSAPDLMRRYLELARAGDWVLEQDRYAVDQLTADLRFDE